ncbi:thiol-disulfide isomerase and thioredoxin [Catenulispora acidiphila DSM 44928]|uniref:Thiol-disulfide isomerase and thioredoxin n=1 Tax=Catenulispora acidiphila (strain DSM 44928 / JCM 14897 / NBRC 102108 / NRRL B-24433 / ID139908) TaxID=479433 RepID=C7Q2A6_CATAD|nr:thioredoxin family protein [Catenulispora acidiphila]ACU77643.1 thiol-disulfide isomerase and thioredoxin [Catenulispora acidiphila DSM 44928]
MEAPLELFDPQRDPHADLASAKAAAAKDGKDILLALGARWCSDCTTFETWTHDPEVAALLAEKYHLVTISVGTARGQRDQNTDIDTNLNHPMAGGIPSLSVLNPEGKIRFDSADGEFSRARKMKPTDLLDFLKYGR